MAKMVYEVKEFYLVSVLVKHKDGSESFSRRWKLLETFSFKYKKYFLRYIAIRMAMHKWCHYDSNHKYTVRCVKAR